MKTPYTLEQAKKIAGEFQHLIGTELVEGKPDTAIKYVVIGPYNTKKHEHFAKQYCTNGNDDGFEYYDKNDEYDVLCIAVYDNDKQFIIDVRMLLKEYNMEHDNINIADKS